MSILICLTNNHKYNFKANLLSEVLQPEKKIYWLNIFQSRLVRGKRPFIREAIAENRNHYFSKLVLLKSSLLIIFSIESYIMFLKLIIISSGDKLLKFKYNAVLWGPLIYDTILRHEELTTIETLGKSRVWHYLNFIIEYKNLKYILSKFNINKIICSDATYVNNGGVALILAEEKRIEVYLTSSSDFFSRASVKLKIASRNYFNYKNDKNVNEEIIKQFEVFKEEKFNPKTQRDLTLPYMKVSAYSRVSEEIKIKKNSVVIFAHDFLDAFHFTGVELFKDYFTWLKETCQSIKDNKNLFTYYIKPHPNSSDFVISQTKYLVSSYDCERIVVLSEKSNNQQVFLSSPKFVVSLRGNVLYEAAFFGVKCLAGNDSPYVNFNFVYSSKSKNEYFELLNCQKPFNTTINETELLSFYTNHYATIDKNLSEAEEILCQFNNYNFSKNYYDRTKHVRTKLLGLLEFYFNQTQEINHA